jgi:hypothetical protein
MVRELRNQLVAKLEQNEDFRVLRGLEFVLSKETRLPKGSQFTPVQTGQPGARTVQDALASTIAANGLAAEERSSPENKQFGLDGDMPLVFHQVRTAS